MLIRNYGQEIYAGLQEFDLQNIVVNYIFFKQKPGCTINRNFCNTVEPGVVKKDLAVSKGGVNITLIDTVLCDAII